MHDIGSYACIAAFRLSLQVMKSQVLQECKKRRSFENPQVHYGAFHPGPMPMVLLLGRFLTGLSAFKYPNLADSDYIADFAMSVTHCNLFFPDVRSRDFSDTFAAHHCEAPVFCKRSRGQALSRPPQDVRKRKLSEFRSRKKFAQNPPLTMDLAVQVNHSGALLELPPFAEDYGHSENIYQSDQGIVCQEAPESGASDHQSSRRG